MRAALLLAAIVGVLFVVTTPPSAEAGHLCGATGSPLGAFDIETYEADDYAYVYARTLELAGHNELFPDLAAFAVPPLGSGDREAGSDSPADGFIPPVLLKAIATIESNWAQADWSVPYGSVGDVLASHDCGYGMMQITSGMQNITGAPNLEQAMIGGHYAFNIAKGAQILATKWNLAPEVRPIVGDRDPAVIENWYYALWGYNGFAFQNHPQNPGYAVDRVPYSCGPQDDGFGHDRTRYPYQELVMGCVEHPAEVDGVPLWEPQEARLPDLANLEFAIPLSIPNWNACSFNANCGPMDIPTPMAPPPPTDTPTSGATGSPTATPAPTMGSDAQAALAFSRDDIIGSPDIFASPSNLEIVAIPGVSTGEATISILNSGSGVLAYRVSATAPWIKLSRRQGLALGTDVGLKLSSVVVTADVAGLPPGVYTGEVIIDSLHAKGVPFRITVTISSYPSKTLLTGTGPGVYIMSDGVKRGIPNAATFEANGFDWDDVLAVPDSNLDEIPEGQLLPDVIASGNLVEGPSSGIYVMDGGRKRLAGSQAIGACGYDAGAAYTISDATLAQMETGSPLDASTCPNVSPPDGHLIRGSGSTVYLISGGLRRAVPNLASFSAAGYAWANVDQLHDSIVDRIPVGNALPDVLASGSVVTDSSGTPHVMEDGVARPVSAIVALACGYSGDVLETIGDGTFETIPKGLEIVELPCSKWVPAEGALIRDSGDTVYLIEGGLKRGVPNLVTFEARGLQWGDVDDTRDSQVASVPTGQLLPDALGNGYLISDSDGAVYIMESGAKRRITSTTVFADCGYDWDNVGRVSDGRIASIPAGVPVVAPSCPSQSFY